MKKLSFMRQRKALTTAILAALVAALVLGLAFVGCATNGGSGGSAQATPTAEAEITVEQAFENARRHFGNPEIAEWADQGYTAESFNFYVGSFNASGWNAALAYLDSLPASFYGERLDWNSDQNQQDFRFGLQLRHYLDWTDYGRVDLLQLEFNYPVNGKRYKIDLTEVAPKKALEIAQTMVDLVK